MIRLAQEKDLDKIVELNFLLAQETEDLTLDTNNLKLGVNELLNNPLRGKYYVYEKDGDIVGQLLITYEWSDWRNGDFWWIQSVYVRQKYRNQGVFKELFEFVKREALENKEVCGLRLYVEKGNRVAKNVYQSLGMQHSIYDLYEWEK